MAFLPAKENRELQAELKLEYVKLDYVCFVNELLFYLNNRDPQLTVQICNNLLFVLNKILLDNLFRHIAYKTPERLMVLLANRTFSKDIYINPFYTSQIIEATGLYIEDKMEVENHINKKLQQYIDSIYMSNSDALNVCLMNMFNVMYQNFHHIDFSHFKFELLDYRQPMLLYTERQHEVHLHT